MYSSILNGVKDPGKNNSNPHDLFPIIKDKSNTSFSWILHYISLRSVPFRMTADLNPFCNSGLRDMRRIQYVSTIHFRTKKRRLISKRLS